MKLKDFRLDIEALFSQSVYGHGYLHYGYWENGIPEVLSLENLGKAQDVYFNKLLEQIPSDVSSLLDVGSGTGSIALGLLNNGFSVDCVCPSANLNNLAKNKLMDKSTLYECLFEQFNSDKSYDLVLFAESFHYIQADIALKKCFDYSNKYVLIFDYFRRKDSDDMQRISHNQFKHLVNNQLNNTFDFITDIDVTEFIVPTFHVMDTISNEQIKPFVRTAIQRFKKEHKVYGLLFSKILNKLLYFGNKTSYRQERFEQKYEYRIILMQKKPD